MDMENYLNPLKSAFFIATLSLLTLAGCKKDEEPQLEPLAVTSGIVVACEGTFGQSNASLHLIYDDGKLANDIYSAANNVALGDVLQNYRVFNNRGYAVVNNSQKVEVINPGSFSSIGTITGCDYPRDVVVIGDNKGYITNGSTSGELLTFNPGSFQVTGSIETGDGPEEVVYNGTYLFVANSGGFGVDSTVTVIDPVNDQVVATVEVGHIPVALEVDYQNNVWVLCKGQTIYNESWEIVDHTEAELMRIDGQFHTVTGVLQIGELGDHPQFMAMNPGKTELYIVNDGEIRPLSITTGEFEPAFNSDQVHSIGVHPVTGEVYASSVPNYVDTDEISIFTAEGVFVGSFEVGVAPRAYAYRE